MVSLVSVSPQEKKDTGLVAHFMVPWMVSGDDIKQVSKKKHFVLFFKNVIQSEHDKRMRILQNARTNARATFHLLRMFDRRKTRLSTTMF